MKLDLEYFCPKRREKRGIGLGKFLYKKAKGGKRVGLRKNVQTKREKESKVKQVRRGVKSPVR